MTSQIVIVGAGFVGLSAARQLATRLRNTANVLLIDPKDHFIFAPRLVDALAGDVEEAQIKTDLALIADQSDFQFLQATVERVDRQNRRIYVNSSPNPLLLNQEKGARGMSYDILILSQGARTCYFDIPGTETHTVCLKQLSDVYRIHDRIHELIDRAKRTKSQEEKRALLSFVVVGGGASGVESVFACKRYVERHCRLHAPKLQPFLSFRIIEAGPQLLKGFPPRIVNGALQELNAHGITVHVGKPVSCVENQCVIAAQERLPAALTIWAAGILPNVIPIDPEVRRDAKGCFITDRFLALDPCIFAAGDAVTHQDRSLTVPKNAQTAIRMSRTIVQNVMRSLVGKPLIPFRYVTLGSILIVGSKGFIDIGFFAIKTRLAALARDIFYRYRHWQMTKN